MMKLGLVIVTLLLSLLASGLVEAQTQEPPLTLTVTVSPGGNPIILNFHSRSLDPMIVWRNNQSWTADVELTATKPGEADCSNTLINMFITITWHGENWNLPMITCSMGSSYTVTYGQTAVTNTQPVITLPAQNLAVCQIVTDGVNVRKEPNTDSEVIGGITTNSGIIAEGTDQNGWYYINYFGQPGWVAGYVVTLNNCDKSSLPSKSSTETALGVDGLRMTPYGYMCLMDLPQSGMVTVTSLDGNTIYDHVQTIGNGVSMETSKLPEAGAKFEASFGGKTVTGILKKDCSLGVENKATPEPTQAISGELVLPVITDSLIFCQIGFDSLGATLSGDRKGSFDYLGIMIPKSDIPANDFMSLRIDWLNSTEHWEIQLFSNCTAGLQLIPN